AVNANPARFDQKKADAINAEHIRRLDPADFADRLRRFLTDAGRLPAGVDDATWRAAADLVQTRIVVLSDAWPLLSFLFVAEGEFVVDGKSAGKHLQADARPVIDAA